MIDQRSAATETPPSAMLGTPRSPSSVRTAPVTTSRRKAGKRKKVLPREHGAWAVLYGPFLAAVGAIGRLDWALLPLLAAMTALFLSHEPLAKLARTSRHPVNPAKSAEWKRLALLSVTVSLACGAVLLFWYRLFYLIPFGAFVFVLLSLHLWLIRSAEERRLSGELLGVAGLTASAPIAAYVLVGNIDGTVFQIWALTALYFASGIFFVRMQIARFMRRPDAGKRALQSGMFHLLLAMSLATMALKGWIPGILTLAYAPVVVRAFLTGKPTGTRPNFKKLGYTEVAYTALFIAIFSLTWSPV